MPDTDFRRLISLLESHDVDYVIVGGHAGTLHGAHRPTVDLDVVPRWHIENLARLCDALRSVGARSLNGPPCTGEQITPEVLVDREVMTWDTDLGSIDTLMAIPDPEGTPVSYEALRAKGREVRTEGIVVHIASLDHIIASKEFASRAKDHKALPELRRLAARAAPVDPSLQGANRHDDSPHPDRGPRRA